MRKYLALILSLAIITGALTGCSGSNNGESTDNTTGNQEISDTQGSETGETETSENTENLEIDPDNVLNQLVDFEVNSDPVYAEYENDSVAAKEIQEIYNKYYDSSTYTVVTFDSTNFSVIISNLDHEKFTQTSGGDVYVHLDDGSEVGFTSDGQIYKSEGHPDNFVPKLFVDYAVAQSNGNPNNTSLITHKYSLTLDEIMQAYANAEPNENGEIDIPASAARYTIQTSSVEDIRAIYDAVLSNYGSEVVDNYMNMLKTSEVYEIIPNAIPNIMATFITENDELQQATISLNYSDKPMDVNDPGTWDRTFTLYLQDKAIPVDNWELQRAYYTYDYSKLSEDQGEFIITELNATFSTIYPILEKEGLLEQEVSEDENASGTESNSQEQGEPG